MNFTLDQLLALDAIARTGSFASAANELHKVPSAVSYSIQCLESALGVDVFDRSRRKAVLTDAGQKILSQSRSVITAAQNLERVASELKDGWEPELHVVVDGALPMDAVLDCIRAGNSHLDLIASIDARKGPGSGRWTASVPEPHIWI